MDKRRLPKGIMRLPGVVPSLRLLLESEKYSLTDVALMFGVSTERIRQICDQYGVYERDTPRRRGVDRGVHSIRVWDDELNRFIPVRKRELRRRETDQRIVERRARSDERRQHQRAEIVATLIGLAEKLGRPPLIRELGHALNPRLPEDEAGLGWLTFWWMDSYGQKKVSGRYRTAIREMYAEAGLPHPVRGRPFKGRCLMPGMEPDERMSRGEQERADYEVYQRAHRGNSPGLSTHHQRAARRDTDFGECLGCRKPMQPLQRVTTGVESFIWRCPDCAGLL